MENKTTQVREHRQHEIYTRLQEMHDQVKVAEKALSKLAEMHKELCGQLRLRRDPSKIPSDVEVAELDQMQSDIDFKTPWLMQGQKMPPTPRDIVASIMLSNAASELSEFARIYRATSLHDGKRGCPDCGGDIDADAEIWTDGCAQDWSTFNSWSTWCVGLRDKVECECPRHDVPSKWYEGYTETVIEHHPDCEYHRLGGCGWSDSGNDLVRSGGSW